MIRRAMPHELEVVADHAAGWARRSHGRWTADQIMVDIAMRERQAWVIDICGVIFGVALTRLSLPVAFIDACSGRNRQLWQDDLDDTIAAWAQAHGAQRVISFMRPGWKRAAERRGWRLAHVEMVRDLR